MNNVIQFPGNEERKWNDVASDLKPLLIEGLGATPQEAKILLERLRPRWERIAAPFEITIQQTYSFPEPMTTDQLQAIKDAIDDNGQAYAAAIRGHVNRKDTKAICELAELEIKLLRRGG